MGIKHTSFIMSLNDTTKLNCAFKYYNKIILIATQGHYRYTIKMTANTALH